MAFTKGNKLGKGRPKGRVNIASHEKRQLIEYIKDEGAQKFIQEMMTLEGMEYCKIYKDVVELSFPKLSRVEHHGETKQEITFKPLLGGLSSDELAAEIAKAQKAN